MTALAGASMANRVIGQTRRAALGGELADGSCIKTHEQARCCEIYEWVSDHKRDGLEFWCAVDDMDLFTGGGATFREHFVRTNPHFGLQDSEVRNIILKHRGMLVPWVSKLRIFLVEIGGIRYSRTNCAGSSNDRSPRLPQK